MKGKFHYAWMIVFVTFLAFLAVQGGRLAFGAFVEPWEQDLHMDRATTSLISTISFVIYGLSQPFIGRFIDKYGARLILSISTFIVGISFFFITFVTQPWQLFVIYSLVSVGVGGASNVAGTVLITNWFNKKRGLALGIMEAGFGFGQMLLVPGSLMLIHWFDWRITIFILGALLIVIVFPVVFFFLRNHPDEKEMEPLGGKIIEKEESETEPVKKSVSLKVLFKMRQFWFLMLPFAVCGFTTTGLMDTHLIPLSHHHGFSATVTGTAVSILAACNIVGILLSGVIIDYWSSRKLLVFIYFTRALSIGILVYSHNTVLLLLFAAIFGFVDFATVAPTQLLLTQYFKNYSIGFIVGCLSLSHQIGSALGAYIPGLLYSSYGNYELSLYISILIVLAAAIMNLLLPEPNRIKIVNKRAS
ncbi:MFS transporter [Fredinandcohnia sp. QZ13]|uniref:MFS transporter n=1 Tax=Fredinandcohnia sp. QZ13 TaxID=3073144 RepID=UPI00285337CC|nr:MFS transporter [Fredinandcohnia sp. QZ13]MDR4886207.1 MFS transporter [Fredinandcohnia sp. QZ13]